VNIASGAGREATVEIRLHRDWNGQRTRSSSSPLPIDGTTWRWDVRERTAGGCGLHRIEKPVRSLARHSWGSVSSFSQPRAKARRLLWRSPASIPRARLRWAYGHPSPIVRPQLEALPAVRVIFVVGDSKLVYAAMNY
jgi:hypothetical protein